MLTYPDGGVEVAATDVVDFDGQPLTDLDVDTAVATVYTDDWSAVVAGPLAMTYDADASEWRVLWEVDGAPGGATYRFWVEVDPSEGPTISGVGEVWIAEDPRAA